MAMYQILITTEKHKGTYIMSERQANKIAQLQYLGDFRRFGFDIVTDQAEEKPSDFNFAISYLSVNVFNVESKTLKAIIK